jgi:hypothetical protein
VTKETTSQLTRPVNMLLLFLSVLVLVDTVFFTALTPLLPHHTHTAHLSKPGARHPRRRVPPAGQAWRTAQHGSGCRCGRPFFGLVVGGNNPLLPQPLAPLMLAKGTPRPDLVALIRPGLAPCRRLHLLGKLLGAAGRDKHSLAAGLRPTRFPGDRTGCPTGGTWPGACVCRQPHGRCRLAWHPPTC